MYVMFSRTKTVRWCSTLYLGIDERAEILRLRRRFLKDREKVSLIYARKGVAEQKREQVCQSK